MMNSVNLIGRLTRDPELRYTSNAGVALATFTLAVDRPFTNQQGEREADFIRIVTWRKQAENCANYLSKGRLVAVVGRLQVRNYETPEGERRTISEVVADNVQFLERKDAGTDRGGYGESTPDTVGEEVTDEDVPF